MNVKEAAAVAAYINSPENLAWERELAAKWAKQRGEPSPIERRLAAQREKTVATRNALGAKRHAAKINRTPAWADMESIKAVYADARRLTKETGIPHHVDHEIPLQGKLVSGLHVENNLQILPGPENCRKHNRFEVEV